MNIKTTKIVTVTVTFEDIEILYKWIWLYFQQRNHTLK
jgi:hypothetical protein